MALQESLIKLNGSLGDLSFYKTTDGYLARRKTGVSAARLREDPAFIRLRENGSEFARAGKAARLIRVALRSQIKQIADKRMTSRLIKVLVRVIQADAVNVRGMRNVIDGEAELLQGFEFNANGELRQSMLMPFTTAVDRVTGALTINVDAFVPQESITFPSGATHCKIIAVASEIDFETGKHVVSASESSSIALTNQSHAAITLAQSVTANSTHPIFLAMGIVFYQQVNTQLYALANRSYNALAFVKVDGGV